MGRGRGKGKKSTTVASHDDDDDPGSGGEEVLPPYKRRGRPQKPLKDEIDEDDGMEPFGGGDDNKPLSAEAAVAAIKEKESPIENGKRRKRHPQVKERPDSAAGGNGNDEPSRSNGYRHNGSRRKNTPRRAAEAGVDCE